MITFSTTNDQGYKSVISVRYIVSVSTGLVDIASEDGSSIEKHALYISTVNGNIIGVYETRRACGKEHHRVLRCIQREDDSYQVDLDDD